MDAALPKTWLTDRFGLQVPVVGAPMAGVGGGAFAAAVSGSGALGMIGVGPAAGAAGWLAGECAVARASGKPYGVGLMAWALDEDDAPLGVALENGVPFVSVTFGDYEPYVERLRAAGVTVATQVGNRQEALRAASAGVDVLVARGGEAGGHGRNDVGTLPLLEIVLDAVDLPVLAAGGISTARGLAAVLAAGAAGAWVGTAFLASPETATSAAARERLLAAGDVDTSYGRVFDVAQRAGWPPEYGGRSLRNAFFDRWDGREDELARDDAAADELAAARRAGDFDTAYVYAGQGVALLGAQRPAAQVVAELARAGELLARAASGRMER